jgi:hypothetical protein
MISRKRGKGQLGKNLIFPVVKNHLLLPFLVVSACFILASFNIQAGLRISLLVEDAIINRVLSGHPPTSGTAKGNTPSSEASLYDRDDLPSEERLARIDWSLLLHSTNDDDILTLDLGVPVMGNDEKLLNFFAPSFGRAVDEFHAKVVHLRHPIQFRLLVSRYPSDDSSTEFQQALAKAASFNSTEDVVFVRTEATSFHRSHAINLLHNTTRKGEYSVLAIADVDMWIGPRFLFNALKEVDLQTIYFPIVFSEYRPSTVLVVEKFLGSQSKYSKHKGIWRGTFSALL